MSETEAAIIMHEYGELWYAEGLAWEAARENNTKYPLNRHANIEEARQWWLAASELVQFYSEHGRAYGLPMPDVVLHRLARIAEWFSIGKAPDVVRDALAANGRRGWEPPERRGLATAIFYMEAVEMGLLEDASPTKTVSELFKVSKRAVQKWKGERERICRRLKRPPPDQLPSMLKRDAADYWSNRGRLNRGELKS